MKYEEAKKIALTVLTEHPDLTQTQRDRIAAGMAVEIASAWLDGCAAERDRMTAESRR